MKGLILSVPGVKLELAMMKGLVDATPAKLEKLLASYKPNLPKLADPTNWLLVVPAAV